MMEIALPRTVCRRLRIALWRAGSREIGGILMGKQLAPGSFEVVDFSLDNLSGDRAHFVRSVGHHVEALSAFFERTGHDYSTYNYLGEWHSHPRFSLAPSQVDIASMRDLTLGERDIDFAVLMIVRTYHYLRLGVSATLHSRFEPVNAVTVTFR